MLKLVVGVGRHLRRWLSVRITIVHVKLVCCDWATAVVHRLRELQCHDDLRCTNEYGWCRPARSFCGLDVSDIRVDAPSIAIFDANFESVSEALLDHREVLLSNRGACSQQLLVKATNDHSEVALSVIHPKLYIDDLAASVVR